MMRDSWVSNIGLKIKNRENCKVALDKHKHTRYMSDNALFGILYNLQGQYNHKLVYRGRIVVPCGSALCSIFVLLAGICPHSELEFFGCVHQEAI